MGKRMDKGHNYIMAVRNLEDNPSQAHYRPSGLDGSAVSIEPASPVER